MSAFSSFQHHHLLPLDSVFLPNSNTCFSQFTHPETLQSMDQSTKVSALSNDEASVVGATNTNNMDSSSTVTHDYTIQMGKKRKCGKVSCANSAQSKDMRAVKSKKQKKSKDGEEKKAIEEGPLGYIHVRARRGQATDSHSLAERVRREKISERMKLLQSIVPGCDKVTGKAPVLDRIINYVQSLQNQVEILSLKLASVNPISYDFAMEPESFMVSPDQNSSLPSTLPAILQWNPATADDFLLLDDPINPLVSYEQDQFPHALPVGSGVSNNLFSLH